VFDAAMKVYSENGWGGFTFEAVARRAKVGKAAVYRRWSTREDLFRHMIDARWQAVGEIDSGALYEDLLTLGYLVMKRLNSNQGRVIMNMQVDARRFPEVRQITKPFRAQIGARGRAIVERAILRGEVDAATDPILIYHAVIGAIFSRIASHDFSEGSLPEDEAAAYVESAVALMAKGLGIAPAERNR